MSLAVSLAAALAFMPADARAALEAATELVGACTPRDAGTIRGRMAANFILDAAKAKGAKPRIDRFQAETPLGVRWFSNVEAEWCANPTGEWVVVVSHYDTKSGVKCPGANDGASTSGLLLALAGLLSGTDAAPPTIQQSNLLLLWLDGEECVKAYGPHDGLWGSKRAAARLRESGRRVKAVICLDMLGDRDLNISLPHNTSPELRALALRAAARAGAAAKVAEIPELVKDDHLPFFQAGFHAVDLIDFDYGSAPGRNDYWHTPLDTPDKLSVESLLLSGRILCEMLNELL